MAGDGKPPAELEDRLRQALGAITLADTQRRKEKYDFWETQPVVQFSEADARAVSEHRSAQGDRCSQAAALNARPCGPASAGGRPYRPGKDGG